VRRVEGGGGYPVFVLPVLLDFITRWRFLLTGPCLAGRLFLDCWKKIFCGSAPRLHCLTA